jgi:hypothetical protein
MVKRVKKNRTLLERITSMRKHVDALRARFEPILRDRTSHNLTEQDQYYGTERFELLNEELESFTQLLRDLGMK